MPVEYYTEAKLCVSILARTKLFATYFSKAIVGRGTRRPTVEREKLCNRLSISYTLLWSKCLHFEDCEAQTVVYIV